MAIVGEDGKIRGGKVTYHAVRALEAVRWATEWPSSGPMLDTLAYDHARAAARAALNRTRKVKR
ncbi:hypothetical protein LCGC14_2863610 [marine sediment metagenome]|uniref:Uncharacterized protein n=1 Tax=marine sediment metagenome TaxID=412755 RepID=A0A0F8Y4W6_9ZZZZ